jgi:hypothetical protein
MLNEFHVFISSLVYKVGIRDGFLSENPEFKIEGVVIILLIIFGYFVSNNYKNFIYLNSFFMYFLIIYSTHKYRNNFHFSPNCEIYNLYSSSSNPYLWNRLGWDVLHPPNVLKFYAIPCEIFNNFKIMNLFFFILLIASMFFVNKNQSDRRVQILFELTFLLSVVRIFEGHTYLYIMPFAYYALKTTFENKSNFGFIILGFLFGFRIIPFVILVPIIYKLYKKNLKFFIVGGILPFIPITRNDFMIYKDFLENITSQRIITFSNSYFAQNIWNLEIFDNLSQTYRYLIYFGIVIIFSIFILLMKVDNLTSKKLILFSTTAFIICLSPRSVPYEMFLLIPLFSFRNTENFFTYFYFLSFSVQLIFIYGSIFGEDYLLNISSVVLHFLAFVIVLSREFKVYNRTSKSVTI